MEKGGKWGVGGGEGRWEGGKWGERVRGAKGRWDRGIRGGEGREVKRGGRE